MNVEALTIRDAARTMPDRLAAASAAVTAALAAPRDALANYERAAQDCRDCGPSDAVLDAQEKLDELMGRLSALNAIGKDGKLITLMYGTGAAYRSAVSRVNTAVSLAMGDLKIARRKAGMEVSPAPGACVPMDEPPSPGSYVRPQCGPRFVGD